FQWLNLTVFSLTSSTLLVSPSFVYTQLPFNVFLFSFITLFNVNRFGTLFSILGFSCSLISSLISVNHFGCLPFIIFLMLWKNLPHSSSFVPLLFMNCSL